MDLFDFDFTVEINDESIQSVLNELAMIFKKRGNPHFLLIDGEHYTLQPNGDFQKEKLELSPKIKTFIPVLEEHGYIKISGGMISLHEKYRDYHTVEEILHLFREHADEILANGGSHYDLYNLRTNISLGFHGPGIRNALEREVDRYGIKLGLKHFTEVPKSRGHKMNRLDKGDKKLIKKIAEAIIPMKTWEEVENYFRTHAFYRNENDIITFSGRAFDYQCLAEATDAKTVELILSYMGGSWMGKHNQNLQVVYPDEQIDLFSFPLAT